MSTKHSYRPRIAARAGLPRQIDRHAITHRLLDDGRMSLADGPRRQRDVARAGSQVARIAGHALPNLLLAIGSWVAAEVLAGCAAYAEGMYGIRLDPADHEGRGEAAPSTPALQEDSPACPKPDLFLIRRTGGLSAEPGLRRSQAAQPGRACAVTPQAAAAVPAGRHAPIAAPALRLLARLQRVQSQRRAAAELHGLDDRSLRDLGITRGEIDCVVRRGTWFG